MTDGISHIAVDGFEVWCLEDGTHVFDAATFPGCAWDEQQTRLAAAGLTGIRTVFNVYLIRDPAGGLTLVDTGCGDRKGYAGGALPQRLAALDVAPAAIDRLVFTHLHSDHVGGTLVDGALAYPNARVVMHPAEAAHWTGTDQGAGQVLAHLGDGWTAAEDGAEIVPGLTLWHLPGHTPGHAGLRIGSRLVLVGDIIHSEALQLGDPRLCTRYDVDPALATDMRLAALRTVADGGLIWSGSHMLGPSKFARLAEIGDGFIRVPL